LRENKEKNNFDLILENAAEVLIQKESDALRNTPIPDSPISSHAEKRILRRIRTHGKTGILMKYTSAFRNTAAVLILVGCLSVMVAQGVDSLRGDIWSFVVEQRGTETRVYVQTTANVPSYIKEFKEPKIEPEGLIKKVMWQEYDYHLIGYFRYEDDRSYDSVYTFSQKPFSKDPILISDTTEYTETKVNGYDALTDCQKNRTLTLTWHDDEYIYRLTCKDKTVTIEDLIKIAESVQ